MSNKTNELEKIFCFQIFINNKTHKKYLLFKGVASKDKDNIVKWHHRYDYMYTNRGYLRLNNYYDLVRKLGPLNCNIIDNNKKIIAGIFKNQKEIENKFKLTVSKYQSIAFSDYDKETYNSQSLAA